MNLLILGGHFAKAVNCLCLYKTGITPAFHWMGNIQTVLKSPFQKPVWSHHNKPELLIRAGHTSQGAIRMHSFCPYVHPGSTTTSQIWKLMHREFKQLAQGHMALTHDTAGI